MLIRILQSGMRLRNVFMLFKNEVLLNSELKRILSATKLEMNAIDLFSKGMFLVRS